MIWCMKAFTFLVAGLLVLTLLLGFAGGGGCSGKDEVVVYTSVDEPVAKRVASLFEARTGVHVVLVTDTEATKTSSLAERVEAERERPRGDVYWGNEPFHTIRLAEAGVFDDYRPPTASEIPPRYADKDGRWTGIGYRVRMLVRSTRDDTRSLVKDLSRVEDLTSPALKGKIGICTPAVGTVSGQFAALYVVWGQEKYRSWLLGLRANDVKLLGGNSVVAESVGNGTLLAGLTDNDDVQAGLDNGAPLEGVVPNQTAAPTTSPAKGSPKAIGTLIVPTTIAVIKGGPNSGNARRFVDFASTRLVEDQMISAKYLKGSLRDLEQSGLEVIDADPVVIARAMREAIEIALTILQDRPGRASK
jgi:iron(III) transport system substrate-binding protein